MYLLFLSIFYYFFYHIHYPLITNVKDKFPQGKSRSEYEKGQIMRTRATNSNISVREKARGINRNITIITSFLTL